MPRPAPSKKKAPGVSYKAAEPVYELFISVRSTPAGTTVALSYYTHALGDEPQQGHYWRVADESTRPAKTYEHLANLAAWALRQGGRGSWRKVR